jgi:hypothetical protein
MLVGSSMAFANPDQTNPRETSVATPCGNTGAARCETISQDTSVTPDAISSSSAANEPVVVDTDHDDRRDRNRRHERR